MVQPHHVPAARPLDEQSTDRREHDCERSATGDREGRLKLAPLRDGEIVACGRTVLEDRAGFGEDRRPSDQGQRGEWIVGHCGCSFLHKRAHRGRHSAVAQRMAFIFSAMPGQHIRWPELFKLVP